MTVFRWKDSRAVAAITFFALVSLVLAGCSSPATPSPTPTSEPSPTPGPTPTAVIVQLASGAFGIRIFEPPFKTLQFWTFDPATLVIKIGVSLNWTNTGAVLHAVTADDGSSFDSGDLDKGATFNFTPRSPGTYSYYCKYHPWMKGTLFVQP